MVAVNSTMLPLGTVAPPFALPDPSGRIHSLDGVVERQRALLVIFLSNHCPYVTHIARALGELTDRWAERGVAIVGIASNDTDAYPDDAPDAMITFADEAGWGFPYLVDAGQSVALDYHAACTPDFFLFDSELHLVYRGQLDGSRPANDVPVTGADLDAAIEAVLNATAVPEPQYPSIGCSIKWKPDNEPAWSP